MHRPATHSIGRATTAHVVVWDRRVSAVATIVILKGSSGYVSTEDSGGIVAAFEFAWSSSSQTLSSSWPWVSICIRLA